MRLTVLGCWAPFPRAGGACSGYLLQDGGANILLDIGHGAFSRLRHFVHYADIRAVVVTHLHPDHYGDLPCLRHATRSALREKLRLQRVKLFLPAEPQPAFRELTGDAEAFFEVVPIESLPEEEVPPGVRARRAEIGPVRLFFLPVRHTLPAYAVGVEGSGYLVYSGDAAPSEELAAFAEKAGIFLCEASGLDKDAHVFKDVHMTARQAGELAACAKVKELIITHFFPEYDLGELCTQARQGYGDDVEVAVEGNTYFLY
ncbi:MAG: MBL fold metallo-hydrolase [Bacillota bacterium]